MMRFPFRPLLRQLGFKLRSLRRRQQRFDLFVKLLPIRFSLIGRRVFASLSGGGDIALDLLLLLIGERQLMECANEGIAHTATVVMLSHARGGGLRRWNVGLRLRRKRQSDRCRECEHRGYAGNCIHAFTIRQKDAPKL